MQQLYKIIVNASIETLVERYYNSKELVKDLNKNLDNKIIVAY